MKNEKRQLKIKNFVYHGGFLALFTFSFLLFNLQPVRANGFGSVLDKVVGEYTANVDYSAQDGTFIAGYPVQFAFQLFTNNRTKQVNFRDAWVTVTSTGSSDTGYRAPIFDAGIMNTEANVAVMLYTFPSVGTYDLKVLYHDKDGKTLVEATFPISVAGPTTNSNRIGILIGGAIVLALDLIWRGGSWWLKRKTKSASIPS